MLNRSKMGLIACSVSFSLITSLGFYENDLAKQVHVLQQRLSSLKNLAVRSQETALFIQSHQEDFAAFEACAFEQPLVPETLQASFRHSSFPCAIEFGTMSPLSQAYKNSPFVTQAVSFSIPCLRDRDVFAFLHQLTSQGPGIFQIHDVTVTRTSSLNEEMLGKIASGKPQALFEGRIAATWIHQ